MIGGSHGGFLTGHLVGQQPRRFRCAVLRNPVCDLSLMIHVSDIPDWCYVEAWGSAEGRRRAGARPTAEDVARFWGVSPIAHVDKVQRRLPPQARHAAPSAAAQQCCRRPRSTSAVLHKPRAARRLLPRRPPQVTAPLLFLLGARDRRVPMDDAKQYINAVR